MKKISVLIMFVLLFLSCNRYSSAQQSRGKDDKNLKVGQNEISKNIEIASEVKYESLEKIKISLDYMKVYLPNEESYYIGMNAEEDLLLKKNTSIETTRFGGQFGPIDGYSNGSIILGWNNQNRIVYIEILNAEIKTKDHIGLNSSEDEVLEVFGAPHIEKDDVLRYQNTDFEVVGILFDLNPDRRVSKITIFTYV